MTPSFQTSLYNENIEQATRWWNDYPTWKYTDMARPEQTYRTYMNDVWSRPKRLARTASYTNMTYIKEAVHDHPIRRSPSVSSLAPSLSLPYRLRNADRIVERRWGYIPDSCNWYRTAYCPEKFHNTLEQVHRPMRYVVAPCYNYRSHVPYYTMQTRRLFFDNRYHCNHPSYLVGSQLYLDRYVSARLKADDYAQRFAYTSYEWHSPQMASYNRHMLRGSAVSVPVAVGNPAVYNNARGVRRLYTMTGRFYF